VTKLLGQARHQRIPHASKASKHCDRPNQIYNRWKTTIEKTGLIQEEYYHQIVEPASKTVPIIQFC